VVSEHSSVGAISARAAVVASALALALVVVIAPAAPAATATAHQRERTGVSLVSQTGWVTGSRMWLDVAIHSPLPRADLGLKLTVYSRLTSRYAFDLSESGQLAPTELVLGSTPIIPLRVLHVTGTGVLRVAMHVRLADSATAKPGALGSPGLALDCAPLSCDGVYPLDVAVVDTAQGTRLASFTTYLVYVAGEPGSIPLRVALVLPFGSAPALVATGAPTLTSSEIASLAATLATIRQDPGTRVTLAVYPQLLVALAESPSPKAAVVLGELRTFAEQKSGAPSLEFLEAPFTPVSLDELTAAGLGREFRRQLDRAAQVFRTLLGATPPQGVYLSTTPLDDASLAALARNGIERVVIPATGLPTNMSMSHTAPLRMLLSAARPRAGALSLSALVADSALAAHFAPSAQPALAAHQFLAEIALVYFEQPFGQQARGVVVAPATIPRSPAFLSDLLEGLESSPIAEQSTVASLFSAVPVGADGAVSRITAVPAHAASSYAFASSIGNALSTVNALASTVPGDAAFLSRAGDATLLAETAGLGQAARMRYTAEPLALVGQIEHAISLAGARTVTLTQRRAKVPLTIVAAFPSPIHATLMLSSSTLAIASRYFSLPIVLAHKNSPFEIPVTARTSGVSTLTIELVSPRGGILLFEHVYTIRSTAFSVVAVALSVAALIVLALWWLRSHLRRRRRAATERAGIELGVANGE
jgi:hypothetical protein